MKTNIYTHILKRIIIEPPSPSVSQTMALMLHHINGPLMAEDINTEGPTLTRNLSHLVA